METEGTRGNLKFKALLVVAGAIVLIVGMNTQDLSGRSGAKTEKAMNKLQEEIRYLRGDLQEIRKSLDGLNDRLDRIEAVVVKEE